MRKQLALAISAALTLGGLNGIIVDKSDQSRIYRLSGVTRTPGIIAKA